MVIISGVPIFRIFTVVTKSKNLIKVYGYTSMLSKGWSGGAMVLGKRPVPGRPTLLKIVGQGPTALVVGAGGGCLDILLSSIFSLLFLPLFGRRSDID